MEFTVKDKSKRILLILIWTGEILLSDGSQDVRQPGSVTDGLAENQAKSEEKQVEVNPPEEEEISLECPANYSRPCVPKCCRLNYGFTFEHKSRCISSEDEFLPDFEDWTTYAEKARNMPVETRYEYFIGDPCLYEKYLLDLSAYPYDKYSIYSNGTLLYLDQLHSKEEFCLESLNGTVRVFKCFVPLQTNYQVDLTYILYALGLITSIPFLLITAFVYLSIEKLRDLRGKSLACHALCLAGGYLTLALVQLASNQLNEDFCIAAGFLIQYCFVAAFFWLNVICFESWRCIKNDFRCVYEPRRLHPDKYRFLYYSLYAWYVPSVLSIVSLIMDLNPAIPESFLKPNFGLQNCWFYSNDAALPYFYGPVGIIILINFAFFVLSARIICLERKKQKKMLLSKTNSTDETREKILSIRLYIKILQECGCLFCVMGINWAAEVVSWALGGPQIIWLITDIFNALQGFIIFYLFVIKPCDVRNELKSKFHHIWKRITKCGSKEEMKTFVEMRPLSRQRRKPTVCRRTKPLAQSTAV